MAGSIRSLARHLMVLTPILAAVLGLLATNASAQSEAWSAPRVLSQAATTSWFPDIAVDPSGRIHVAWSSGVELGSGRAYDTVVYTTSSDGSSWSSPMDVIAMPSKGAVTRPALLTDPLGVLHLSYRSYRVYYSQASVDRVGVSSLLSPRPISSGDNGYFSGLLIDDAQRLHIFFTEYAGRFDCPECLHVFRRVSDDGGLSWSASSNITPGPLGAAKPDAILAVDGSLHLVWESGRGGDLGQLPDPTTAMYTRSLNGGLTWTEPFELNPPADQARNPALALTGAGQLVAVWLGLPQDRILYRTSSDGGETWTDPRPVPDAYGGWTIYQGRTDGYSMVTDGAGVVHLLAVGRTTPGQENLSVLHLAWDGEGWSAPEEVTTVSGDVPEWPRAAVGLGNQLHAVWFVRDEAHIWGGDGVSQYRIWYASRSLDAPATVPTRFPTALKIAGPTEVAATITASAVTSPTPTRPPLSGPSPEDAVLPAEIENRSVLLVVQAMFPVAFVLGAITFVAFLRRR